MQDFFIGLVSGLLLVVVAAYFGVFGSSGK